MHTPRNQYAIFFVLCLLTMLPNFYFVATGIDSALFTPLKKSVFLLYTLALICLPTLIFRPKIIFLLYSPFIPLMVIDLFTIATTKSASTSSHYYAVYATNINEAIELFTGNLLGSICIVIYLIVYLLLLYYLNYTFKFQTTIRRVLGAFFFLLVFALFVRDFKIASSTKDTINFDGAKYHFFIKLNKTYPYGSLSKLYDTYGQVQDLLSFTSKMTDFDYGVTSFAKDENTIVLVIGETARKANFELYGYNRNTNPLLKSETNLIPFTEVTTCANYTYSSFVLNMSSTSCENYSTAYTESGICEAFQQSGYKTYWITNQDYYLNSPFKFYSQNADYFLDISKSLDTYNNDLSMLPHLEQILSEKSEEKKFIIIHTIGSHYRYNLRYPSQFSVFKPELDGSMGVLEKGLHHKEKFVNSYDNTLLLTDYFLSEIIQKLKNHTNPSLMMYASDHGENLYDDARNLFLHGLANPSKYELEIPFFIWHSDNFNSNTVEKIRKHKNRKLSTDIIFHSLSSLGGFQTKLHNEKMDLLSDSLVFDQRKFLKADGSVVDANAILSK
ncbi:MAG: phosphoethanolamine transferase [Flavicella sp.]